MGLTVVSLRVFTSHLAGSNAPPLKVFLIKNPSGINCSVRSSLLIENSFLKIKAPEERPFNRILFGNHFKIVKTSKTHYKAPLIHYNRSMIHYVKALIHYDGALKYYESSLIHSVTSLIHSVEPLIHSVEANSLSIRQL